MELSIKSEVEGVKCKEVAGCEILLYEKNTIDEMKTFLRLNRGAGLAAPQIGIKRAFFIMNYGHKTISCYNPSYRKRGDKNFPSKEACLTYGNSNFKTVRRHKMIVAKFLDNEGFQVELKLQGFSAALFQHETDHLTGKTIFFNPAGDK